MLRTRRLALPLFLIALSIPSALAAPAAGDASADTGAPVTATVPGADKVSITGDHFVVDDARHQAVFSGNVVVVQKQVTVHSDQVTALYGKGGATSISTFTATGHVKLVTKDQTATGEMAVFNPFDFFLEPQAERFPFAYDPALNHELAPF